MENLGKLVVPAVWVGLVVTIIGIVVHFTPGGVFLRATAGGWLNIAQSLFLLAIAVALSSKK